jgi:glycerol-3-phosphate acyltransferase PlsY
MPALHYGSAAILGYLFGNLQSAIILSRLLRKPDIRTRGSGNAGSTNMLRVYGVTAGLISLICDLLKGVFAVVLAKFLISFLGGDGVIAGAIAGLFVVLGHDFPVFFGFRGGKGVATTLGVMWALIPPIFAVIITVVAVLSIVFTSMVSVGSLVGGMLLLGFALTYPNIDPATAVVSIILAALLIIRHTENIKRILRGKENKITFKKNHKIGNAE